MILNRNYYDMVGRDRRDRRLLPPDRRDAPLPAARPQLRAAHAPVRRAPRLHGRVPARPEANRRRDAGGAPDRPADRAARAREGAHRSLRELRRRDGRQAAPHRLGARRRQGGQRAPPATGAGAGRASRSSTAWPTASSTRRSRRDSADGCAPRSQAALRCRRRSASSSTCSTSSSSRDTARPRRRRPRTSTGPNRFKFGTVGPPIPGIEVATAEDGEILIKGPDRLRRLLQRRGSDARSPARETDGCTPATSARSTRTAS